MGGRRLVVCAVVLVLSGVQLWSAPAGAGARCLGHAATKAGGPGPNTIRGTAGRDVLVGGGGNDTLIGFQGNDFICGGAGADLMFLGPGRDRADGGPGDDVVSYNETGVRGGIRGSLGARRARGRGLDTWKSIEGLAGSPNKDRLGGSRRDDFFLGLGGEDRIKGGGGDDLVAGMDGSDRLFGGPGDDMASFYFGDTVRASLKRGRANGQGNDRLDGFEGLEGSESIPSSTEPHDELKGDEGKNFIFGGKGIDVILGNGGNDFIAAGKHGDVAFGLEGNDQLLGQGGPDRLGDNAGPYLETGNDRLIGGSYRDPDDGRDTLYGGPGKDLLYGALRADKLNGGDDEDVADFSGAPQGATVELPDVINDGSGAADKTTSIEDVYGSRHMDRLQGNGGPNFLYGFGGPDRILGMAGEDVLKGFAHDDHIEGNDDNDLLVGGDGTDELDGGLGVDTCRKGEDNTMCELPPPIVPAQGPLRRVFRDSTGVFGFGGNGLDWPEAAAFEHP